jgi:F0F1-type ATP synthase assembly protein I
VEQDRKHRPVIRPRLLVGLASTILVTAIAALVSGMQGAIGAAGAGVVATGVSLLAVRLIRRTGREATIDRLSVYGIGVVLRMLGVLIIGVLMSLDPARFPALPTALGYLGVILPLLYMETR